MMELDLTDSDDDLDITKAVKKDLGHEDYINSMSDTLLNIYPLAHTTSLFRSRPRECIF